MILKPNLHINVEGQLHINVEGQLHINVEGQLDNLIIYLQIQHMFHHLPLDI